MVHEQFNVEIDKEFFISLFRAGIQGLSKKSHADVLLLFYVYTSRCDMEARLQILRTGNDRTQG